MGNRIKATFDDQNKLTGAEVIVGEMTIDELANSFKDPAPSVTIKKAKIKDGLFLEVEFHENTKSGTNKVNKACTMPIHDDLRNAFKRLDQHLASICEQYDANGSIDTENTSCRGLALGGSGESEGFTLVGTRSLDDGKKIVNLVSPFTKYSDEYEDMAAVSVIIRVCIQEAKLYLFEGKQKPQDQLSMFEEETDAESSEF